MVVVKFKKIINIMDTNDIFKSYRKVLLFGSKGVGKSSLSQRLKTGKFEDDIPQTEDGKLI